MDWLPQDERKLLCHHIQGILKANAQAHKHAVEAAHHLAEASRLLMTPGVCSFCWNFTERQIFWSLCSVDFHTLTLQLPIQTLHSVAPELQVCVSSPKTSAKRAHPLNGRFSWRCNTSTFNGRVYEGSKSTTRKRKRKRRSRKVTERWHM